MAFPARQFLTLLLLLRLVRCRMSSSLEVKEDVVEWLVGRRAWFGQVGKQRRFVLNLPTLVLL